MKIARMYKGLLIFAVLTSSLKKESHMQCPSFLELPKTGQHCGKKEKKKEEKRKTF